MLHFDNLSVRMTTDANGNNAGQQATFPFGEDWYTTNAISTRHFTTYERDSESSNDYAVHRFYVNRLARFSSTDPVRGSTTNPQSWNRYAYVNNDPIDHLDAQGLECLGFCSGIFGCFIDSCCAFDYCPVDPDADNVADSLQQLVDNYLGGILGRLFNCNSPGAVIGINRTINNYDCTNPNKVSTAKSGLTGPGTFGAPGTPNGGVEMTAVTTEANPGLIDLVGDPYQTAPDLAPLLWGQDFRTGLGGTIGWEFEWTCNGNIMPPLFATTVIKCHCL